MGVAQLVEWSFRLTEIRSSNPLGEFFIPRQLYSIRKNNEKEEHNQESFNAKFCVC